MNNIEYNESIDLICAVFRVANRKQLRGSKKELNLEGIPQIEEWVKDLESRLNPFLLSDIDLLARKIPITTWNMIKLARTPDLCPTAEDFLQRLSNLSDDQFLHNAKESVSLKDDEEFSREIILKKLTETTSNAMIEPEEESEMILSMLKNPGTFLQRIKILYNEFYDGPFKASQNQFGKLIEKKLNWHRNMLKTDATAYLDEITRQIYSSFFDEGAEPDLFLSFYYDFDFYLSSCNNIMVIGAGTDEIIESRSNRNKADILFSILGDKKRLELLRLISQRPWYSSELADYFGITPATMSYHLNKMVSTGFVKLHHGEQKRYYYTLNKESVRAYFRAASGDILGMEDIN
jgi:DNA-binding transcriptional ArsR family regulator